MCADIKCCNFDTPSMKCAPANGIRKLVILMYVSCYICTQVQDYKGHARLLHDFYNSHAHTKSTEGSGSC